MDKKRFIALYLALSSSGYVTAAVINTPSEARSHGLDSLSTITIPEPPNLAEFVKNKQAAILLGKALFWDQQVGSDGQACASCHFHAGADNRVKNQLNPGLLRVDDPSRTANPDISFGDVNGMTGSSNIAGPNYTLNSGDFPFHQLSNINDRNSSVTFNMNDVASSQGTFDGGFISLEHGRKGEEVCGTADGEIFNVAGIAVRKVEPRNTPTVINAVFNHRNFWDGRANNIFNGLNPLGRRGNLATAQDSNPGVLVLDGNGQVQTVSIEIENASLASQAVGPPLSDFEMSCAGKTFADLGKKLRIRQPLANQQIDASDSVLGSYRKPGKKSKGLKGTYQVLIQKAFHNKYWEKDGDEQMFDAFGEPLPLGSSGGFTQLEANFALFWGLSIQLYEATLVSDQSPFDQWMEGQSPAGFGAQELVGLNVFVDKGQCINCHVGAEFTGASVRERANNEAIERMIMGDGGVALYDGGFYNIGVRPTLEDLGIGANIAGFPISFAQQEATGNKIDQFNFDPNQFEIPGPIVANERVAVDGAFKVPTMRNVELTGPFFHNGGQATLSQVVDFYNRGGDRRHAACQGGDGDTSGLAENCSNVDPDIVNLGLTETEKQALVAFLVSLTDPRVRVNANPFDRPQLSIPNGHPGNQHATIDDGTGQAEDSLMILPATGTNGGSAISSFLNLAP